VSAVGDINFVKKLFVHPCATPSVSIMVETGLVAGAIAFNELATLGCLDIMTAKLGKPHVHHRGLKGILSGAMLGNKLTGTQQNAYMPVGMMRAPLFWVWIAGVGTSFAANWASMAYQMAGCAQPGAGYFTAPLSSLFIGPGQPGTVLIDALGDLSCVVVGGNKFVIPGGCTATITYWCQWVPFLGLPENVGPVKTYIRERTGRVFGESLTETDPAQNASFSGSGAGNLTSSVGDSREYEIRFEVERGLMGCVGGALEISAYGRSISLIPSGCKPKAADWPFPTFL